MDQASGTNPISKSMLSVKAVILYLFIAVVVVGILFLYLNYKPTTSVTEPPAGATIESPDLGSNIYEKASNPVSGQLPESVAPVSNPLEGIYQNPFE